MIGFRHLWQRTPFTLFFRIENSLSRWYNHQGNAYALRVPTYTHDHDQSDAARPACDLDQQFSTTPHIIANPADHCHRTLGSAKKSYGVDFDLVGYSCKTPSKEVLCSLWPPNMTLTRDTSDYLAQMSGLCIVLLEEQNPA